MKIKVIFSCVIFCFYLSGCSPQAGPDKTVGGALIGGALGAGSGAVIGHQLSYTGEGAAIGAAFGLVSGMVTGAGFDLTESALLTQEKELASIRAQNMSNGQQLANLQGRLDRAVPRIAGLVHKVFFDEDSSSLRAGSVANLQSVAEAIKKDPGAYRIQIDGHTDDAGDSKYREKISEARARAVSAYLGSRGVSMDHITVESHGSERPLASNTTADGRRLNRRAEIRVLQ